VEKEDLDMRVGDVIDLIESGIVLVYIVDDNWYLGSCRGKRGIFPKSFVALK
jgi:hypothetical protein